MAAALPSRPTPRQNLDGVMIDISSRRPHRVYVNQLARDRPRSPEIAISWHAAYALSGGRKCPTSGGHSKPSTHPPQPSSWLGRKELQVAQPTGASASPWPEACCGTLPEIAISPRDEGE